jgi:hypothetical protein
MLADESITLCNRCHYVADAPDPPFCVRTVYARSSLRAAPNGAV